MSNLNANPLVLFSDLCAAQLHDADSNGMFLALGVDNDAPSRLQTGHLVGQIGEPLGDAGGAEDLGERVGLFGVEVEQRLRLPDGTTPLMAAAERRRALLCA